jgi:hypothetical protein
MRQSEQNPMASRVMKSKSKDNRQLPKEPPTTLEALDGVATLYTKSLAEHGLQSKGVGWKDDASHQLRFEKLSQVIDTDLANEGIMVNDLGCGYGAMFAYLDGMRSFKLAGYVGYDISEEMLGSAQAHVKDARAKFVKSPRITHEADYSFVCGTFNVKLETTDEVWSEYIKDTLMNLAAMSSRGFAFNALSTYVDWREKHLYYADPSVFFEFCKRNISRYVTLLHDYPLFEWTMIVRK